LTGERLLEVFDFEYYAGHVLVFTIEQSIHA
jgi:hypothetical protein